MRKARMLGRGGRDRVDQMRKRIGPEGFDRGRRTGKQHECKHAPAEMPADQKAQKGERRRRDARELLRLRQGLGPLQNLIGHNMAGRHGQANPGNREIASRLEREAGEKIWRETVAARLSRALFRRRSRLGFVRPALAFRDAGRLAAEATQIIELCPAHFAPPHNFHRIHQRAVDREDAFNALAIGDLPHREALVQPRAGTPDADAFKSLKPLARPVCLVFSS